jgi:hypothetical protein
MRCCALPGLNPNPLKDIPHGLGPLMHFASRSATRRAEQTAGRPN